MSRNRRAYFHTGDGPLETYLELITNGGESDHVDREELGMWRLQMYDVTDEDDSKWFVDMSRLRPLAELSMTQVLVEIRRMMSKYMTI